MKPVDDSPLDHLHVEHERSSFLNGSDDGPEDLEDLPPPPMIVSEDDPYFDYPDDNRMPTPPPSPGVSPFNPPRSTTPVNGKALCPAGREGFCDETFWTLRKNDGHANENVT